MPAMAIPKCEAIRNELKALLWAFADIEKKHGVKVRLGNGIRDQSSLTIKVEFAEVAADGNALTREATDFKMLAGAYGLKPEDLFKTFTVGGKTYKIVGCRSRASKKPILCETGGKVFIFSEDAVRRFLATEPVR